MGMDNEDILDYFYDHAEVKIENNTHASIPYNFEDLKGELSFDLIDASNSKLLLEKTAVN